MKKHSTSSDLLVLSHLRWDFVFQRPQHLLTRCARDRRVFFFEEPVFEDGVAPRLDLSTRGDTLHIALPRLPTGMSEAQVCAQLSQLIDRLVRKHMSRRYFAWYYTPMALDFTRQLKPATVVYDCMDELSHFKNAPPHLLEREDELFQRAHVVFTGGISLYEHKSAKHDNIHPFPSSVDVEHFARARTIEREPEDQAHIPHPRIGYAGVIDERFDIELVRGVSEAKPEWQLVLIGPVVKIDAATLPRAPNIHYLGPKHYEDLPAYLSGWQVGLLPFARNDSTRFISPTKTPEYLAAGRRVVSTSIRDVVRTYGERALARIADTPRDCVAAIEASLGDGANDTERLKQVDDFLSRTSWDQTFRAMWQLVEAASGNVRGRRRRLLIGREPVVDCGAARKKGQVPREPLMR
jgi:UDP-galactopyranose mutase